MTVTCPSCEARFRDPPAEVSKSRPFQCGKCEHKWVQESANSPRIQLGTPSLAPEMADVVDNPDPILTALPVVVEGAQENLELNESDLIEQPIFVDRAPPPPGNRPSSSFRPMFALTCVAAIAGSLIFKDAVMGELPQTASLYKAAGLASDTSNLEIANVITTKSSKDGISQLIVKGEIQNVADNTVPVPPLKLTMRGESQANLFAWTVSAVKTSLKAGEKSRFTAVAHDFPNDAVDVEVEFVPSEKK